MGKSTLDQEHIAEAERLRQLPRADQRAIVAMHWTDARNPRVPKADRDYARQRARALESLLKLGRKK
jgi:hypothetical protein